MYKKYLFLFLLVNITLSSLDASERHTVDRKELHGLMATWTKAYNKYNRSLKADTWYLNKITQNNAAASLISTTSSAILEEKMKIGTLKYALDHASQILMHIDENNQISQELYKRFTDAQTMCQKILNP